jgi:multiple sugar transport system ATP-binding protein
MAEVILKNINKVFPGPKKKSEVVWAVHDFNLHIPDKQFCVFVGPSGCGKTTTLRLIAGLEEISSGEIFIGDRLVNNIPPKDRDIAMVFQNYALYPHMNVYKNMAFGLKLRKRPKQEIKERVEEAAEILGITHLLDRKPKALSGGQRQRVAVGRTIVRKPKVFLFDEPLSNLDAKLRVQMRTELKRIHERLQATMIYVTHDQTEAMTMGDSIVVMKDGIMQQVADPITLYDKPVNKFVAGFIGSPPMNFLECKITKKNNSLYLDGESFNIKIPDEFKDKVMSYVDKEVVFGVRPEDIDNKLNDRNATADQTLTATVEVVEPMGAEIFLHMSICKNHFLARLDPHDRSKVGDKVEMVLKIHRTHIFDKETEMTII